METITHTSFVYKWTHLPTGKWYIGCRTAKGCHPKDGYITSSKLVKNLIKTTPEEWQREILHTGTPEEILNLEVALLEEFDAKNNLLSYNQHNGDGKFTRTGVKVPLETRLKQSESIKKVHPNRGKPSPNKGKIASEETRKKQSEAKLGKKRKPFTEQTREKIRQAKLGSNNPSYGRTPSEETKEKLRQANQGKKEIFTCPHCEKTGGGGSMTRWHFDSCKQNKGK
jgi:group I intron endonuclease